jgi:pimeloyl-ACP methyl ester carboxylesterase
MEEKTISVGGNLLFYRVIGKGKTVILVHGFAEEGSVWDNQVEILNKEYRLIIPDLPGSGRSPIQKDMSMEGLAASIHEVLLNESAIGGHKPIMIGHSMGGYITLAYAEKYRGSLAAIGLVHSSAFADNEEKKAARRKSIDFIREHGAALFIEQSTPNLFSEKTRKESPEIVKALIEKNTNFSAESLVHYYDAMMARPDRTQIVKEFPGPVLYIIGRHDNAVPLQQSLQQCHMPILAYIHILRDSGHMGMLEEPALCTRFLEKFLQESEIANP